MSNKVVKVGIMGLGAIGKVHSTAYSLFQKKFAERPIDAEIVSVFDVNPPEKSFLEKIGNPSFTDDIDDFFSNDLDLVDICTPNFLHYPFAKKVVENGLMVYCEKPLGLNVAEAMDLVEKTQKGNIFSNTGFIYRYLPCVNQMKTLIDNGRLGTIFNFRFKMFLSSYVNPNLPLNWRLQKDKSGGGALADLGIHLIDTARYLLGEVENVGCETRTFIKKRPVVTDNKTTEGDVDVDDWALCTLDMKNGSNGIIEVTRCAGGMGRLATFEIFGSEGSVTADFMTAEQVRFYSRKQNEWITHSDDSLVEQTTQNKSNFWLSDDKNIDFITKVHLAAIVDMLFSIHQGKRSMNDFGSALVNQNILETAYKSAQMEGKKVHLQ